MRGRTQIPTTSGRWKKPFARIKGCRYNFEGECYFHGRSYEMTQRDARSPYLPNRRAALQIGVGMFGLTLPQLLAAKRAVAAANRQEVSCIFLFLAGGPSHFETFDPKPEASEGIRGLWNPTATSVPGTFICEKMPLMAQRMHKAAIIRSWKGSTGSHSTGSQYALSGVDPGRNAQYFPNFGCVVQSLLGTKVPGVPSHMGLPVAGRYTTPPGYLGPAYAPLEEHGDPSASDFQMDNLRIPPEHLNRRRNLLDQIDVLGTLGQSQAVASEVHQQIYDEAFTMLTSTAMKQAANLGEEPRALRERYGMNIYGQRVLLARRLIEAGSRFVTINQAVQGGPYGSPNLESSGTWDNHSDIFSFLMTFGGEPPRGRAAHGRWTDYEGPGNLPQLDMSLSTLLDDLDERGMLETTLVVAMGEFGRTPKINAKGGRDHYPRAGSVLMAGAGVQGGAVIGATDRDGTEPVTRPWYPQDFAASIYHAIGLDANTTYYPRLPRPTKIAEGEVIEGLFA